MHENFFEAGGHSLLAVAMLAHVETTLGVTLPISTLFHAPTISLLARAIAEATPISRRVLVPLQPSGSGPAIVFVHALGGEAWTYVPLARHLAPECPSFGVQLPDFRGRASFPTVEELASIYVDALQREIPGPYVIAGYSSGATIGFEMAQQLQARGAAVELLVALDGGLPNRGPAPGGWRRSWGGGDPVALDSLRSARHPAGRDGEPRVSRAVAADERRVVLPDPRRTGCGRASPPWRLRPPRRLYAYRPRGYDGRVMVVTARARPLFGAFDPDLGWKRMVPGALSVVRVPGLHQTFLREPYVRQVAEEIRRLLQR